MPRAKKADGYDELLKNDESWKCNASPREKIWSGFENLTSLVVLVLKLIKYCAFTNVNDIDVFVIHYSGVLFNPSMDSSIVSTSA